MTDRNHPKFGAHWDDSDDAVLIEHYATRGHAGAQAKCRGARSPLCAREPTSCGALRTRRRW